MTPIPIPHLLIEERGLIIMKPNKVPSLFLLVELGTLCTKNRLHVQSKHLCVHVHVHVCEFVCEREKRKRERKELLYVHT